MRTMLRFGLLGIAFAGCHLALGIEDAETMATGGGPSGCTGDEQCDDENPCTADSCSGGNCHNTPVPDGDAPADQQAAGDCQNVVCATGVSQSEDDDGDLPVDGNSCTEDLCSSGSPSNPELDPGTACTQANDEPGYCNDSATCRECYSNAHCTLPERCGLGGTPWVCGCTPTTTCATMGKTCGDWGNDECGNPISCNNDFQDGSETDVNCGGLVPVQESTCNVKCQSGKMCEDASDCASNSCTGGICD